MKVEIVTDDEKFCLPTITTATQRAGLRYERRVSAWLALYPLFFPQIAFRVNGKLIVPDGLLSNGLDWIVVEIKNQHCHAAEKQLREYQLALSCWLRFPAKALLICQVYRSELASLPVVARLESAFACSFSILPLGLNCLRFGAKNGLGMAKPVAGATVWASGSAGNSADRFQRVSSLGQVSRTGSP